MLNHKGTIAIETERLMLRQFKISDVQSMYDNWTSDKEVYKYLRGKYHSNVEDTRKFVENRIERYSNPAYYHWVMVLKGSNEPIGTIGLFIVNEIDMCGEVAYSISRKFSRQGYTSEALNYVLKFAFEEIGFNRIEACHAIQNSASGRVMEKAGMRLEGVARQKYKSSLGFEDSNMYAILREDFYENKAKELE